SHASAAPACGYECPVLAGDGGPGGINDGNGRSMASVTARSGRIPALWRPVLAGGGKVGSDFHANAAPVCDSDRCQILARLSQLREGIADFSVKRTGKSESIQGVKNSKRL